MTLLLPEGFDLALPDDVLVELLVTAGPYTPAEAADLLALLRDPEGPVLE